MTSDNGCTRKAIYLSNSFGLEARQNVENGTWAGWLVAPSTWGMPAGVKRGDLWAGDNGCFTKDFTPTRFTDWLRAMMDYRDTCLFLVVPDVLGDPWATLERWYYWRESLKATGFPLAYVGQDRQRSDKAPWDGINCYFVGGTDEWKDTAQSLALVTEARRRGKRVHVGRCNTRPRLEAFVKAWKLGGDGSMDGFTVDGNGWRYPGKAQELAGALASLQMEMLL